MFTAHLPRATTAVGMLMGATPAVAIAAASPAAAHTGLTGSTPDDGATLATPPSRVSLSFNDPMDARYSRVAVTGTSGRSVATGALKVDGRTVSQALATDVPPGRYTVGYRVVSADGHPVSGRYTFTVSAARTTSPAPDSSRSGTDSAREGSSGSGVLPVAAGAAVVLAGVGGTAHALRKRRSRHVG
ncbi:copper resistance protein CopC [Streptomyces sp. OE57]|uniref:copper resistance CopC family protein n=1 Tax=Streptomyces lacaronensis TaxID=3379885 RepID=UPI0039B7649F